MTHQLTWYGHANFQIDTNGKTLIIDPFFEGNPNAPCSSGDIRKADIVLVTHDHRDHVGQAVEICQKTGATLVAIVGTAARLQEAGVPANQIANGVGMNIGGTIQVKGIGITMTQAFHSSASGAPAGYILTLEDGYTIYHAGDTGIFFSMGIWGALYPMDLALLPMGGVFTMDPAQAALACKLLQCEKVVPMHWGTFPVLEQDTKSFAEYLEKTAPETELILMEPGKSVELEKK